MCDERFRVKKGGSSGIEERLEKLQLFLKYSLSACRLGKSCRDDLPSVHGYYDASNQAHSRPLNELSHSTPLV